MLICISVIITAAIQHKAALIAERASWADPFLDDLLATINQIIQTYLGVDNSAQLREKTALLEVIRASSYEHLSKINTQMRRDYRQTPNRLAELYATLGFNKNWSGTKSKDQEATIDLLFAFKQNLTPSIRTEMVAKGINATRIDAVMANAQTLLDSNITQEAAKKLVPTLTEAANQAFNNIYDRAMDVAIISRQLFKDASIKDQFSYSKALAALNNQGIHTLKETDIDLVPSQTYIEADIALTAKTKVTFKANGPGVAVCRTQPFCDPANATMLVPDTETTLTKKEIKGSENKLVLTNTSGFNVTLHLKIEG